MLTLNKAIEILNLDITYSYPARFDDLQDATALGREAMIRLQFLRKNSFPFTQPPLPGEDSE